VMPQREHAAAVRERLVDGEIEAVVALLQLRPVERAGAAAGADAAALWALPGAAVGAVLEEQELDAAVRCGFQRGRPAARRPAAAAGFLTPPLRRLLLLLRVPLLEDRLCGCKQLR